MEMTEVRPLLERDIEEAGAVLGRAFQDEPIFVASITDPIERLDLCTSVFTANLRHALRYGGAWVNGPDPATISGVVYWVARPEPELSDTEMAELGYQSVVERWGDQLDMIGRMEAEAVEALGPIDGPWHYLAGVGVDPNNQGRGYGSALIKRVVENAARAGVKCALVTDRERNVPLYERCGFRTVASRTVTANVRFWSMIASSIIRT